MANQKMRNYCFTTFNVEHEFNWVDPLIRYVVYQHEICPETGRDHFQGYVELTKPMRVNAFKRLLGDNTMHVSQRRGTRDQARDYCMKEDSRKEGTLPIEHGHFGVKQGNRSDLDEIYTKLVNGASLDDIMDEYPAQYTRYYKAFAHIKGRIGSKIEAKIASDRVDQITLRPWQEEVIDLIEQQNDRQVLWVHDSKGNQGKSVLGKYLKFKFNAFYTNGGERKDIAHEYDISQKIVVFDLERSSDYMPYKLMEMFKNGLISSPKYESAMKISNDVKVVVFSNHPPVQSDRTLSEDRWVIKVI